VLEHVEGHGDHVHGPEDAAAHGAHGHREGPWTMVVPVAILTVLSTIGGLLQIAGVWHPFGTWVGQVAEPLVEPSTAQDWATSAVAVAVGLAGVWVAWAIYLAGRIPVPTAPQLQRALEHKLYIDELYDALFYRPAQMLAARLRTRVETPLVEGSIDEIGRLGRDTGVGVARVQSGLLRTYAIAIAASAVVLAVVFVAVR
jgi:NADH-quinone oxidoreductase subunit L